MPPHYKDVIDLITNLIVALGIPGGVAWFIRDRRRSKAATEVEVETVADKIESSSLTTINNRVALLLRVHDAEKAALTSTISHQAEQIKERDGEIQHLKVLRSEDQETIRSLRAEVDELTNEVRGLGIRLHDLSDRLQALQVSEEEN